MMFARHVLIGLGRYDMLKANIAAVSSVGCEAFQFAEEKMSMVSDTSLGLWNTVSWNCPVVGLPSFSID